MLSFYEFDKSQGYLIFNYSLVGGNDFNYSHVGVNDNFITTFYNGVLETHFKDSYVDLVPRGKILADTIHLNGSDYCINVPHDYIKTGFVLRYKEHMCFSVEEPILYA